MDATSETAITINRPVHTDPHLIITDQAILVRFLRVAGIDLNCDYGEPLIAKLCAALFRIPYENLTKIIKSDAVINPGSAKRLPDEVIRDYLDYGTGGTCFSLTAAFVAIFNALGIEAHPILADRRYGTDTHCALVLFQETDLFLLDPGYLIYTPTRLPTLTPVTIATGFNTVELIPHDAGRKVDLITIVKNDRRFRLTYKVTPVDGQTFGRAWERSFGWEMMTYPVLTRYSNGVHYYLQGSLLRIRENERTTKHTLSPEEQHEWIIRIFGITRNIVTDALTVV